MRPWAIRMLTFFGLVFTTTPAGELDGAWVWVIRGVGIGMIGTVVGEFYVALKEKRVTRD